MRNKAFTLLLKYAAITGNFVLLIFFLFSRINEEFKGSIYQKISSVGLSGLLVINIFLFLIPNTQKTDLLRYPAIAGNILLVLWILFNGINEGFRAPFTEQFYYIAVMILLVISSIVLIRINK